MKKYILSQVIFAIIICCNFQLSAQSCTEVQDKSILLQGPVNGPCAIYTARDSITLKTGFTLNGSKKSVQFKWDGGAGSYTPLLTIGGFTCSGNTLYGTYNLQDLYNSITKLHDNLISALGAGYTVNPATYGANCVTMSIENLSDFIYSGIYSSDYVTTPFLPINTSFTAKIDDNLWFPINYLSSTEISDPENRPLNTSPSVPVGSTVGQASVSLTGGATYTIPVFSPPGTAGMQPSVSMVYNSQGGNGIAGYGWNIAGLSAITRMGQTIYHDGAVKGVDFNDDRFALDGQRLIKKAGVYGADKTEYYTEVFNGGKIISYGTTGAGPEWFEVIGKDGSIVEYGKVDNARQTSQRPDQSTITWYINKITDPNGNYITFLYNKKPLEINIREIQYTGNASTDPQIEPYNSIKFYYSNRSDKSTAFIAGSRIEQTVILDHIDIVAENKIIKSYKLKYYFDFYSQLNEVEEYGLNGERYNSLAFGYGKSLTPTTLKLTYTPSGSETLYRDFNGDGLTDIYTTDNPSGSDLLWQIYLNKGNGLFYYTPDYTGNLNDNRNYQSTLCDVNGDGLADILLNSQFSDILSGPHYSLELLLNSGIGFTNYDILNENDIFLSTSTAFQTSINIMDINGDHKDEFILEAKEKFMGEWNEDVYIYQLEINNNSVNKTRLIHLVYNNSQPAVNKIIPLDINGDQKDELMIITDDNNTEIKSFNLYGNSYIAHQIYKRGFPTTYHTVYPGDFNGDGRADLLSLVPDAQGQKHWHLSYWNDIDGGFIDNEISGILPAEAVNYEVADYNHDGKTDLNAYSLTPNGTTNKLWSNLFYSFNDTFLAETPFEIGGVGYWDWKVKGQYYQTTDFNGDGINDIGIALPGNVKLILNKPWENEKALESVANGLNVKTKFLYTTLSNKLVYNRNELLTYPLYTIGYPIPVVQTISTDDGLTGYISNSYKYTNGIIHLQGKGFLGFKEIETTSSISPIHSVSKSEVNTTYYFISPVETKSCKYDDYMQTVEISGAINSNQVKTGFEATNKVFLPWQESITEKDYTTGIKKKTEISVDNYCNPISSKTLLYESHTCTSETAFSLTEYQNYWSAPGCIPSKPQDIISTVKRNGLDPIITKKHFDLTTDDKGNLWKATDFYTQDSAIVTEYVNYIAGLPEKIIVSIKNRTTPYTLTTTNAYDSKFRFIKSSTSDDGFITSWTYDYFGNKKTSTNANELSVTTEYDGFGRHTTTTDDVGVWAKTELIWYSGTTKPNVLYYSESTSNNGLPSVKYYDRLGRLLYTADTDPKGKVSCIKTEYNAKGQVKSISEPYFEGTPAIQFTTTTYHPDYGFPLTTTLPTGVIITYTNPTPENPGKTSSVANSATSITTSKTIDATGKTVSATDPGGTIVYTYFSDGSPKTIESPDGNSITMDYDTYGHQKSLTDPDAGKIEYTYNALGELQKQKDFNGNEFTMSYDKSGSLLTKTCIKAGVTSKLTNTYNPALADKGSRGMLASTEYKDEDAITTKYSFSYNSLSQMAQKTIQTDKVFTYFYTYDSKGNLDEYRFPSDFVIKYQYDPNNGTLMNILDKAANKTIYVPGATNARGQMTDFTNSGGALCTSMQYDIYGLPTFIQTVVTAGGTSIQNLETQFNPQTGNLNYRKDKTIQVNGTDLTENFTYDLVHKNRLATWQVTGQQQYTMTYADNNGNILTKSDLTSAANPYIYTDISGLQPHAVKSITAPLQLPAEALQTITYNRFNKVKGIIHTNQALRLSIAYGPDEQRIKSDFYVNNVLNKTKYFVDGDYEVEVLPNFTERRTHYLPGGGMYVCDKNNVKIGMYYVLTDYQSNWYKVVTETGSFVEQYSFDAWGKRRNGTTWSYTGVPTTFTFDRGYTGHEMLDAFGLINMNGRVYDPVIARFLSPDNFVSTPDNSQGFNRYSYCLNNPLVYTDPDGNTPIIAAMIIGAIINVAAQGIAGNIHSFGDFALAAGVGALAGAAGGLAGQAASQVISGSINSVVAGAIIGANAGMAGGLVGGAGNAWANGGSFNNGMYAGISGAGIGTLTGGVIGGFSGAKGSLSKLELDELDYRSSQIDLKDFPKFKAYGEAYNQGIELKDIGNLKTNNATLNQKGVSVFGMKWFTKVLKTTSVPDNYGLTVNGEYVNPSGRLVLGSAKMTSVHISPYVVRANDAVMFKATVGHELIHSFHFMTGHTNINYMERVAYRYSYNVYLEAGQISNANGVIQNAAFGSTNNWLWNRYIPPVYKITPFGF